MPRHFQWLSIVRYNQNWHTTMCFDLLWVLWWSSGPKIDKKCQKCRFWPMNPNYPGALILCQDIFNRYLWSHTIGPDDVSMPYDLSWGLWGSLVPQLVKNIPKKSISPPLDPEYLIWYLKLYQEIFYYYLWSCMINIDMIWFDLLRGLWRSSGEKMCQKYAKNAYFVTPWIANIQYNPSILC